MSETYNLGEAVLGISADLKKLEKALNQGEDKTESWAHHMGDFLEHAFGQSVGDFMTRTVDGILGMFGKIKDGFVSFADMAITGNAQMEGYETKFAVLLGSASEAQDRIAELTRFAATTPFEIPQVVAASAVLQTLTDGALATGDGLRLVGDLASTANVPFEEMGTTVGRLYSAMQAGRPMGEAAARLQELGILSGDVRTKLEDMQEAGASGAEMWQVFQDATKNTNGMMEKQSQTFEGMLSNFSDFTNGAIRTIGAPLFEAAKQGLGKVLELLQSPEAQSTIGHLTELMQKLADGFIKDVLPGLQRAAEGVMHFLDVVLGGRLQDYIDEFGVTGVIADVLGLHDLMGPLEQAEADINKFFKRVTAGFETGGVSGGLAAMFNVSLDDSPVLRLIKAVQDSIQNFVDNVKKHEPTFRRLFKTIEDAANKIWRAFQPVFEKLFGGFQDTQFKALDFEDVIDGVADFIETVLVPAIETFADFVVTDVVPAIMSLIKWFQDGKTTTDGLGQTIMKVVNFFIQLNNRINEVRDFIVGGLMTAFGAISNFITTVVVPAVQPLITIFRQGVLPVLMAVSRVISAVFNLALRTMMGLWERLRPPIDKVMGLIGDTFKNVMVTVSPIMKEIFGPALTTLKKLFDDMSKSTSGIVKSLQDVVNWLNNIADAINNMPGLPADMTQHSPSRWEKSLNAMAASMRDVEDATPEILLSGRRPAALAYAGLGAGNGGGSAINVRGDLNVTLDKGEASADGITKKVHKKARTG